MRAFMDENFMLGNDVAKQLYHEFSKEMPIFDYHCHLNPKEIWENKKFKNITDAWLYGDHYKWRAMRSNGIDEAYITGDKSDYEKFMAWAKTITKCIGNPLYHWTHLELQRYFGIHDVLSEKTADDIWQRCNALLQQDDYRVRGFIEKSNVKLIATTDDPLDTLEYHQRIKEEGKMNTKVVPAFRPDKGLEIRREGFRDWVAKLSEVVEKPISTYADFLNALKERVDFFHENGCRLSDHALDKVTYREGSLEEVDDIFKKIIAGGFIDEQEEQKYKTTTLSYLAKLYSSLNWTMQLHIGAMRNNNSRMFNVLGPDTGFDSIRDHEVTEPLSQFLDGLDKEGKLPKTILYTANPKDNYVLATMLGNFQGDGIPGKIQFGSGWWFNDQKDGMIRQMTDLANLGLLSRFVGMLTDSRSFLSYTRHEYFRRILCNLVGEWVENGEAPYDLELLGGMVKDISYNNAKEYFGIER